MGLFGHISPKPSMLLGSWCLPEIGSPNILKMSEVVLKFCFEDSLTLQACNSRDEEPDVQKSPQANQGKTKEEGP